MATVGETLHEIGGPNGPKGRVRIRALSGDDAAAALECAREVFETSPLVLTSPGEFALTLDEERALLTRLHEHPRQMMLGAFDESRSPPPHDPGSLIALSGMVQNTAKRKLRHCVDFGISIRQAYRGMRVGTALTGVAVAWAKAHPEIKLMTLDVYEANIAGRRLYERYGFREYGRLPGAMIHDDGSRWDQIRMCLEV